MDINAFLNKSEQICRERGARFTDLRRRVLELIARSGRPVGAYTLLDQLKEDDQAADRKAAPPTVYRALDFLLQHGLIHRIASHNTYIVCDHPGHRHAGLFFVCSECGIVVERDSERLNNLVIEIAQKEGFEMLNENLEVTGLCSRCQTSDG